MNSDGCLHEVIDNPRVVVAKGLGRNKLANLALCVAGVERSEPPAL